MTLLVEKGTFAKTTQTTGVPFTQTVTLSNGSLTPKVIWLWTGGQTTNDGTYVDDARISYGFSDTSNDCCLCTRVDESAELETNIYRNDAIISIIDLTTNTEVSRADVSAVAAGSFTLNWAVQSNNQAMVIHYMVAGGTDITNVSVFQTTVGATSTGNKSYNGSGTTFTPDFGMMLTGPDGAPTINTLNSSADNSAFSIGAMKSTTARWVIWKRDETVGTSDSDMFHSSSLVSFQGANTTGAQVGAADFVSFNSAAGGGITVNVTDGYPSASTLFMFLLIKGGTWDVGSFQQRSGTGTQDVTLSPSNLDPELVFLGGINTATSGSVQINSYMSFGGSDGTNEGTTFAGSQSDVGTYATATSNLNTKVYRISTPNTTASSSTTNAEADMNDMTTGGKFTLDWTTADTTQRRMVYWALGTTLDRITKDVILKWNIIGRITKDIILKWNIIGRITKNVILKWHIQQRILKDLILKWHIQQRITKDLILKWNIIGRITKNLILKWNIQERITKALILKWNILSQITKNVILKWNIDQRITKNLILKWNIIGRITKDLILKWNMIGRITKNTILKWNILGRITKDLILKWDIVAGLERVTKNVILKWNIIGRITKSVVLKWHITNLITKNIILKWNIIGRITKDTILKWHIQQRTTKNIILKWNIIGRITKNLILKWNIQQRITKALTLKWNILSRITKNLIIKWNISTDTLIRITKTLTLKWVIEAFTTRDFTITGFIESKKKYQIPFDKWRSYLHRPEPVKGKRKSKHTTG